MAPRRSVPSTEDGVGLARRVRRWLAGELRGLRSVIEASAAACGAEHGRKHFTSYQHLCLLLFHGLAAQRSLRQSYEQFAAARGLVAVSGLAAPDGTDRLGVKIVTDRRDLTAAEVVQVYLWRWQIELFLRWLNSHIRLPRFLGFSENAVELSVWLAILVHLLTLLAARALALARRSPLLLARLAAAFQHLDPIDRPDPPPTPAQPPRASIARLTPPSSRCLSPSQYIRDGIRLKPTAPVARSQPTAH